MFVGNVHFMEHHLSVLVIFAKLLLHSFIYCLPMLSLICKRVFLVSKQYLVLSGYHSFMGFAPVLHWQMLSLFAFFFILYKIDSSQNVLISKNALERNSRGRKENLHTFRDRVTLPPTMKTLYDCTLLTLSISSY